MSRVPRITARGRNRAVDVANFGEAFLKHSKDTYAGKPFIIEDWQWKDIIRPLYGRLDSNGRRWYDRALIVVPRWNGKTELGGLMINEHLFLEPVDGGEAYAVATTLKQAGVAFKTVKGMIQRSKTLRSMVETSKSEILVKGSQCEFRALPHDADTAQGFHASFALIDELHVHKNRDMLNAMASGMIGREEPLLVCITTVGPGFDGVWFEVLEEWLEDPRALVVFYGATSVRDLIAGRIDHVDPRDPAVWRKANPAGFLTTEQLEKAYNRLPFSSFCRYHLNLPSAGASEERAFDRPRWNRCAGRPVIDKDLPCVIAVDASLRRDHTAVALVQRHPDGMLHTYVWFFTGEKDADERGYIDQEKVRDLIGALCRAYNVDRIPCDPAFFIESMDILKADGLPIEEFPQKPVYMSPASQALFDVIAQRRLRHGGDRHLMDHVLAAIVRETGWGWRLDKPTKTTRIDGAIALAIAVYVAESGGTGRKLAPGAMVV